MTSEDRDEMNRLCRLIQEETDPENFTALIEQLNTLLDNQEERLESRSKTPCSKSN